MNTIPNTGRSPNFQVKQIGYKSIEDFAHSLPPNAVVADIGAGLSKLGGEMAQIRNDITWYNIDSCYASHPTNNNAPENLKYLVLDITSNNGEFGKLKGACDVVYSYWLLPHLSLESNIPAEKAILNMKYLLRGNGQLIVGPLRKKTGLLSLIRYKSTMRAKASDLNQEKINQIIGQTKLWWLPRSIQSFSNQHNIHLAKLFVGGKINKQNE